MSRGDCSALPSSQSETSRPSIFTSCLIFPPAKETKVGNTSVVPAMPADSVPGAMVPGHQARVGSRTPPSSVQPLLPRNGPDTPPALPLDAHGPLSLVNSTSVFSASFSSFKAPNTCPTLQSTSSTQSPYTPFLDLPAKSGCGYSGTCMAVWGR